jgi:hypothetical protein
MEKPPGADHDIVHGDRTPDFASAMELAIAELMSKWERFSKGGPFDVLQEMAELLIEEIIAPEWAVGLHRTKEITLA